MPLRNHKPYPTERCEFVVLDIRTKELLYGGRNVYDTALWSEPGTCFGWGITAEIALAMAQAISDRCRLHEQLKLASAKARKCG